MENGEIVRWKIRTMAAEALTVLSEGCIYIQWAGRYQVIDECIYSLYTNSIKREDFGYV